MAAVPPGTFYHIAPERKTVCFRREIDIFWQKMLKFIKTQTGISSSRTRSFCVPVRRDGRKGKPDMSGKERHGFRNFIIFLLILCVLAGTVYFLLPQNEREKVVETVKGWLGITQTYVSGEIVTEGKTKAASKDSKTSKASKTEAKKKTDETENIIASWASDVFRLLEKNNTKGLNKLLGKENAAELQKLYQQYPVNRNERRIIKVIKKDADQIYFGMLYGNKPTKQYNYYFRGRLTRKDGYWQFDCSEEVEDFLYGHVCSRCAGYGLIEEYAGGGGSVCGICGGTGQQYNPYLYMDGSGNWQGGYSMCSGCGGTGHVGGSYTTTLCPSCGGAGLQ